MPFQIQNFSCETKMHCHCQPVYTKEQMQQIAFLEDLQSFEKGKIGGNIKETSVRDANISWLNPDQNNHWLFQKFGEVTSQINKDHFMLDIDGIENFQYTVYNESQHYTWHMDWTKNYSKFERKISAVIMVSDPSEYEGGELEIVTDGNIEKPASYKMKQGEIVYFASWMPHRVKPVTSGKRITLVTWVMGPRNG